MLIVLSICMQWDKNSGMDCGVGAEPQGGIDIGVGW
jgi:hypothetical protein